MSDGAAITLFGDGFRRLMRRALGHQTDAPVAATSSGIPEFRASSGLREFWKGIQSPATLHILDLGSASQANVSFITGLGHKMYTEDLPRALMPGNSSGSAGTEGEEEEFFRENLHYAEGQFDGILCWDLFDFLDDPLVKPLVGRLHRFLKPGGTLLSFFHTAAAGQQVPLYQYRIRTDATLQLTGGGAAKLRHHFNNRSIENLFRQYTYLKFYLARDNLREVIIVR
jgi:SAM-dependent methyltransferase